jgi:putative hydrolase of the HAD superfamily
MPAMNVALLFDLDETLIEEHAAALAAYEATAAFAEDRDPRLAGRVGLIAAARARARELWSSGPMADYCREIGISSSEGLWCRFEGGDTATAALRSWAPTYRRATWSGALEAQGVDDDALSDSLAERFAAERRTRHRVFADVVPALSELRQRYALGLITNGAACLQHAKLDRSGLRPFFDVIVVSAEFGAGKPDASIFGYALSQFAEPHEQAVMLGDSLDRDVDGARSAGLRAIWVNRLGLPRPADGREVIEVSTLGEAVATRKIVLTDRLANR